MNDTATSQVAIWQEVGYRCPRPGFFLGDDNASCPLSNAAVLLDDHTLPKAWHLGRLGVLPLELLHQIVEDLADSDVRALVALRNVNRATAIVVESFRDFATVAAFPRALGALVQLAPVPVAKAAATAATAAPHKTPTTTMAAKPVSLRALAACLRTTACASCLRQRQQQQQQQQQQPLTDDDVPYGDYIYLLTPERVCYACFRSRPEYLPVARFASTPSAPVPPSAVAPELKNNSGGQRQAPLACLRVPPGRYGVLSRLTQPVDLFDRRQVNGEEVETETKNNGSIGTVGAPTTATVHAEMLHPDPAKHGPPVVRARPSRPDPLRYAAVLPGPYWDDDAAGGDNKSGDDASAPTLDRGYACRACAQTDRRSAAAHTGWADPLARYTRKGLQRHMADPEFGGRVLWRRINANGSGGIVFEHDAPRRGHFPPPVEFGATADLARRYEAVVLVPEAGGVVARTRM
ncbi:hypothetical protein SPI_02448 [Niveomyces insectorum RCEF 264]|uniref:F-box domain-containing protein n=1 Tax=Niveomyces insectorum RCEF 264 TaxID=1081102 RepID=A0A167Y0C7_9HYPO|nr:hypothetical protein SPI_02448 [Niveomyces insectorum RCEF 264]